MAPAIYSQHVLCLQLITGPDAPVAFNAFREVGPYIWMAPVVLILSNRTGVSHLRSAGGGHHLLKLRREHAGVRPELVSRVFREDELEDIPSQPPDFFRGGVDIVSRCHRRMA